MTNLEFKQTVAATLSALGFQKHGASFVIQEAEVGCIVGLQKSRFSVGYYLNAGFLIRSLHPDLSSCDFADGDVRTRMTANVGSDAELFEFEKIEHEQLKSIITDFVRTLVVPSLSVAGLRRIVQSQPVLLYQTTVVAKRALGIE